MLVVVYVIAAAYRRSVKSMTFLLSLVKLRRNRDKHELLCPEAVRKVKALPPSVTKR